MKFLVFLVLLFHVLYLSLYALIIRCVDFHLGVDFKSTLNVLLLHFEIKI